MSHYEKSRLFNKFINIVAALIRIALILIGFVLFFPIGIFLIWFFYIKKPPVAQEPDYPEYMEDFPETPKQSMKKDIPLRFTGEDTPSLQDEMFSDAEKLMNDGFCTIVEWEEAMDTIEYLAKQDYGPALAKFDEIEGQLDYFEQLKERAKNNDSDAAYELAEATKRGYPGLLPSFDHALFWYEKAEEMGNVHAGMQLRRIYQMDDQVRELLKKLETGCDGESLLPLLQEIAEGGYPPAMMMYGLLLVDYKKHEAYQWFCTAARLGEKTAISYCIEYSPFSTHKKRWTKLANRLGVEVEKIDP